MDRLQTAVLLRRYRFDLKKEIDQLASELPDELIEIITSPYFPEIEIETKIFPCLSGLLELANSMQEDIDILIADNSDQGILNISNEYYEQMRKKRDPKD